MRLARPVLRTVLCGAAFSLAAAPPAVSVEPAAPGTSQPPPGGEGPAGPGTGGGAAPKADKGETLVPPAEEIGDREQLLETLYERLRQAGNEQNAEAVASAIEKLWARSGSDTVDLLMGRAGKMIEEKDLEVATAILDSIVKIAPDYAQAWNRRAAVHFRNGEYRESLEDLRHALALDPKHFNAINGLGMLMQELGDKKAALRAFREVLKVHPYLDEARRMERELSREVEGQGI